VRNSKYKKVRKDNFSDPRKKLQLTNCPPKLIISHLETDWRLL